MDVLCYEDLDEFGRDLDDPLAELEQDIVHMLLEGFGTNCDATERSIALEDALSGAADPALKHRIEQKLRDDPRIDGARATLTDQGGGNVRIELEVQANGEELGIDFVVDGSGRIVGGVPRS